MSGKGIIAFCEGERARYQDELTALESGKVLYGSPTANGTADRVLWLKRMITEMTEALVREGHA